ncbi:MAG: UbiA-like protein EboC [Bacteroidota bacterium]
MTVKPYFILMRPANIVTAVADILAGISIAGLLFVPSSVRDIVCLAVATIGLYGGGVVYNDIFDVELDTTERPERPLPSGQVTLQQAHLLGIGLLLMGIVAASWVSTTSAFLAIIVAVLALAYDKFSKHFTVLGPLNMGLCRSFNLLLGVSISIIALQQYWYLAVIPLLFIGDITLTSQGEVFGNNRTALKLALLLDCIVFGVLIGLSFFTPYQLFTAFPFLFLWLGMNVQAKLKAIRDNQPRMIQNAVKMGVLSLIPLNASLAAGFSGWIAGLLVLALFPLNLYAIKLPKNT